MNDEGEGYEGLYMKAVADPGSEFVEWKEEEGSFELCNNIGPSVPHGEACGAYSEPPGSGGAKLTAVFNPSANVQYALTVNKTGNGLGSTAIECDEGSGFVPCTSPIDEGTEVKVTATAGANSVLAQLTGTGSAAGHCAPTSETAGNCTFTIEEDSSIEAKFEPFYELKALKAGTGNGTIASSPAGINCGATCTAKFAEGTSVVLTATEASDSHFVEWSGCDSVTANQCTVAMNANRSVTATFFKPTLTVTKGVNGDGTLTSSPAGINCGSTCTALFGYGSTVTLTATPNASSAFKAWSGCDAIVAENKCQVTLGANRLAQATFAGAPTVTAQSVRAHDTTVRFEAEVDPEGEAGKYRFQYVTEDHFQAEGFFDAPSVPVPAASLPSGDTPVAVQATATGLIPQTAYRFRVVAINSLGEGAGPPHAFSTYPSEGSLGPCSNEALRSGHPSTRLPDCRAYEQASPVDKNGGTIGGRIADVKAALHGDGVTFEAGAGIPGGDGAQEFPLFMAVRNQGGWSTHGLYPPASLGEKGEVLGWTSDFELTFDTARPYPGSNSQALLARPRSGSPITTIVPLTSPASPTPGYSIAGSSADNSGVVFSAQGAFPVKAGDPAPAPEQRNLYAWQRETGELSLVGVLPDGTVPADGSSPIGGYAQEMNAVSEDGSAFFTAGNPPQIYQRQHPTEPETSQKDGDGNCVPDPVLACTLAVSASQAPTPDPGGPLPPSFRAAAADGSAAFFTSSEELTENAHTTAQLAIARADLDGGDLKPAFVPHVDTSMIAVDSEHIYWTDPGAGAPGEGRIGRANLAGEEVEPDFITGTYNPRGVAVFEGHIYWSNAGQNVGIAANPFNVGGGSIGRATLNGPGAVTQVDQEFIDGASYPLGIDAGPGYLYWGNRREFAVGKTIARATLDGTTEVKFDWFQENPVSLGTDVAVDSAHNHLYIASPGGEVGGFLARTNLDDPYAAPIQLSARGAVQIAVDGNHIYWPRLVEVNGIGKIHSIARANLDGGEVEDFISAENASGIATDSSHLYFGLHPSASTRGTDLYRYRADSGVLEDISVDKADLLGAEVQGVLGAAADGSSVYYVANGILAPGASPGNCAGSAGVCNLYLWREDPETHVVSTIFLARLAGADRADWVNGPPTVDGEKTARVSRDGAVLLFSSVRRLTAYDNEGEAELYRYRAGDPSQVCVSCSPAGAPPVGPAVLGSIEPGFPLGGPVQMELLSRNLSADGNRIFFETGDALVAVDTNGDAGCPGWGSGTQALKIKTCQDVYEWEAMGTGSCHSDAQNGGCLYLLSSGKSADASLFADADEEGENAFFFTTSQLVGQDEDSLLDVYDARMGGGFASQSPTAKVPCEGEGCKHGASPQSPSNSPSTANFAGPGDPPVKRCPKGKRAVRRGGKARCLPRRRAHKRNRKRHADRRAGR